MKDQIKMIIFVVIMGVVASGILVGTDNFTKNMISDNQDYALKTTILKSFEVPFNEKNALEVFENNISEELKGDTIFYYNKEGNVGFIFEGKGLWGPIEGFMTLKPDLKTIVGIQVIYNEETPGLGGVVAEQEYLVNFTGKQFDPKIIISKDADTESNNEVDAITGATSTSKAFELILNENYKEIKEVLE